MGFFSFVAEAITAPVKVATSVAKATVKSVGHVVTLEPERIGDELESIVEDTEKAVEDVEDALDD